MKRQLAIALLIIAIFLPCLPSFAGVPQATVEGNVNIVLAILRDPKLKGEGAKEVKKAKLRVIYDVMFDDVELSRRTLARNWNKLNNAERREFVLLFRQVLEKAYVDKILAYTNEKIVFDREIMRAENLAEVQTRIITASKEIPITYRVILKNNVWKVYDVVVENVSLVQNYRTQFADILSKNTTAQLLEILKKKLKERNVPRPRPATTPAGKCRERNICSWSRRCALCSSGVALMARPRLPRRLPSPGRPTSLPFLRCRRTPRPEHHANHWEPPALLIFILQHRQR